MRLHLVGLPHTRMTKDGFSECAYTQKWRRLSTMLAGLGHEVILYAADESDAEYAELVPCITAGEQQKLIPDWRALSWDPNEPYWRLFNRRAVEALTERLELPDLLLLTAGVSHSPLADAFPGYLVCEPGVGYSGVLERSHRVFESSAWMHAVYSQTQGGAYDANGRFYDTVIPNFFELPEFPRGDGDGAYALYVGRMLERKGVHLAAQACERAGVRLILAGSGPDIPAYGDYIGPIGAAERARLMGAASCLLAPTLYLEPFGGVVAEAQLTGTPTITTDWGAFTETVEPDVTGWRCRRLGEFQWAVEHAPELDRDLIRQRAIAQFSTDAIAPRYEAYLSHLSTLWDEGFYDTTVAAPAWGRPSEARDSAVA